MVEYYGKRETRWPRDPMLVRQLTYVYLLLWGLVCISQTASSQTIRAGVDPRFPPFVTINEQGKVDGYAVEVLRLVAAEMDFEVSIKTAPWDEVLEHLATDKLDIVPMLSRSYAYENNYDLTFSFISLPQALFAHESRSDLRFLEDSGNNRIAFAKGEVDLSLLQHASSKWEIIQTDRLSQAFALLAEGKVDTVIASRLVGTQLLKSEDLKHIQVVNNELGERFVSSFGMGIPRGKPELLARLNEGLARLIQSGKLQSTQHKWIKLSNDESVLPPIITYGGDQDYPPYEFIDKDGHPAGFNIDLARAAANELGVSILFELGDWKDIRRKFNSGSYDMVSMGRTEQRAAEALFSVPHSILRESIFARKGVPRLQNLSEAKEYRIALIAGDTMHDYALELGLQSNLVLTSNLREALALLNNKEVDYALGEHLQGLSLIKQYGWKDIRDDNHHIKETEYCFAFRENDSALQLRSAIALREIKANGTYDEIYTKWLGILEPNRDHSHFLKWVLILLAITLVIALIALLLLAILRRMVKVRTVQLIKSNRRLKLAKEQAVKLYEESEQSKLILERRDFAINHITDQVLWFNPNGSVAFFNEANCQKLGYTRDEFLKLNISDIDPNFPPERWHLFWRELQEKGSLEFEASCQRKDGSIFPVEVHAWFFLMKDQSFCFVITRDITKRNARLQEIHEAKLKAQEGNRSKSQFLSMVSHELRTPLHQIISPCDILLEEDLSDSAREMVEHAHTASTHLLRLVDCILEYSGRDYAIQGTLVSIQTKQWCQSLLKPHSLLARAKGLSISLETASDVPKLINVYEGRLKQILDNFLDNAVSFSKQGTIVFRIHCSGKKLQFTITDQGPGIEADTLKNIFNPFWQMDMTNARVHQGIGMGLAINQKVAEQCRWKISVQSELGKGSSFTLSLPSNLCKTNDNKTFISQGASRRENTPQP